MPPEEKLKIFKETNGKCYLKAKDNSHIDIEHKNKKLKFKLHKWNREVSIEVFLDMVEGDAPIFSGNKIEIEDSRKKVTISPLDTYTTGELYGDTVNFVQAHDGGLYYDFIYKDKPSVYFFTTPLVCKNTRWSPQPFLTPEDVERGVVCPINMEGGLVAHHVSKKHNQYMTGKILDAPRPIAIDALGNKAFCSIEVDRPIDPTLMTVTPPKDFMDYAVYPVRIDPDFGYTTIGGTAYDIASFGAGNRHGSAWTMPAPGGTCNYLRARLKGGEVCDVKAMVNQKDSVAAGQHGEIAGPVENLACAIAEHWEEFTLSGEVLTEGVDYVQNVIGDPTDMSKSGLYQVMGDVNGAVDSYLENSANYTPPDDPWVVGAEGTTIDYSIFVNYSEPPVEEGGLRMTLSLKGHMGYEMRTRESKARRRMW